MKTITSFCLSRRSADIPVRSNARTLHGGEKSRITDTPTPAADRNVRAPAACLRLSLCFLLCAVALAPLNSRARGHEGRFVAHEWGTFTSVQGGDGLLLTWRPLESSALPRFVYDWTHPGLDRRSAAPNPFIKISLETLQRMETPVIYFYADERQSVDVAVNFPQGLITEWYPQAAQIGPADQSGLNLNGAALKASGARWRQIEILPEKQNRSLADALLLDSSGSHYFAARETDAAYLRINSLVATNPAPEHEKFIFYRGTGNFSTPLRVTTMGSGNSVTVTNTGAEPLVHLFVLGLENRAGNFIHIQRLNPGEQRTVQVEFTKNAVALEPLSLQLGKAMAGALSSQGLYPREATAMVNTWKDSWFAEDGLRVLYVLPRAWTDRTLPLTLTPAPRDLVRVMVGRAEVLTPAFEQRLGTAFAKAKLSDTAAREEALAAFKKLGRFAGPALQLATKNVDAKTSQLAWQLFQDSQFPASAKPPSASPYE